MAGRAMISRISTLSLYSASSFHLRRGGGSLLRPLSAAVSRFLNPGIRTPVQSKCFATRPTTSSLNDSSPNWSNRPPKETILLDGCDFEHWLVVMEPPDPNWTRDEIIDYYIKTLAQIVGSEEEARMKIYSVSTKHYFAFGALVSEELSHKIKALPKVRWVLPDSYLDVKNKDYGGEPFINGQAVPYDPKYHEEWVRNNARANERSRRNDRPRNFDRSRNFERRRENMQNFQNREAPPAPMPNSPHPGNVPPASMPNSPPPGAVSPAQMPNAPPQHAMPPRDMPPPSHANTGNMGPQYSGGMPNNFQNQMPNPQGGYAPNNPAFQGGQGYQGMNPGSGPPSGPGYQGGPGGYQRGPGYQGPPPPPPYQGGNMGYQGGGPNQGGLPGYQGNNPGYPGPSPNFQTGGTNNQPSPNFQAGGTNNQGAPYQGGNAYQGGGPYQGGAPGFQGRDMAGRDPQ